MAAIDDYLRDIENKIYGKDVRRAIYNAVKYCKDNSTDYTNAWNDYKNGLESSLNDLEDEIENIINALIYINEQTGDIVIHGGNLRLSYKSNNTATVKDALDMCMADYSVSKNSGSTNEYTMNITIGRS